MPVEPANLTIEQKAELLKGKIVVGPKSNYKDVINKFKSIKSSDNNDLDARIDFFLNEKNEFFRQYVLSVLNNNDVRLILKFNELKQLVVNNKGSFDISADKMTADKYQGMMRQQKQMAIIQFDRFIEGILNPNKNDPKAIIITLPEDLKAALVDYQQHIERINMYGNYDENNNPVVVNMDQKRIDIFKQLEQVANNANKNIKMNEIIADYNDVINKLKNQVKEKLKEKQAQAADLSKSGALSLSEMVNYLSSDETSDESFRLKVYARETFKDENIYFLIEYGYLKEMINEFLACDDAAKKKSLESDIKDYFSSICDKYIKKDDTGIRQVNIDSKNKAAIVMLNENNDNASITEIVKEMQEAATHITKLVNEMQIEYDGLSGQKKNEIMDNAIAKAGARARAREEKERMNIQQPPHVLSSVKVESTGSVMKELNERKKMMGFANENRERLNTLKNKATEGFAEVKQQVSKTAKTVRKKAKAAKDQTTDIIRPRRP